MEASKPSPPLPKYLQLVDETKLTSQCRDLLPSLPLESAWISGSFHQYQGYWLDTMYLQGLLEYRNHLEARDSDIFLVTLPKSGTTWLKAMVFALVNRNRYPPSSLDHPLLSNNPHDLFIFMEYEVDLNSEKKVPDFGSLAPPRIFSTHCPYALLPESVKESNCKIIYLCRNPKDLFVSLWNFANKLRGEWRSPLLLDESFDVFCRGVTPCGPYWDNVLGHWKESLANPDKVMFLKYEDLKRSPGFVVRRIAEFLGCPFSPDEESTGFVDDIINLCSFKNLSSLGVNGSTESVYNSDVSSSSFFRRGAVGDWENFLTPEMVTRIDRITDEKFRGSSLSF